jgi:fatty-acyl-CoA synthase
MSGGLAQVLDALRPRTARRLLEAGALSPKSPLGIAAALPWLIGRGPSLGIVTQMHAVTLGGKTALIDRGGSLTWGDVDRRANQMAHALLAAGVEPGDKVGVLLRNGREMADVCLAAQKVGIIGCPLNTWAKAKELKAVMEGIEPRLMFYDVRHSAQVEAALDASVERVHVGPDDDATDGSVPFDAFIHGAPSGPPKPLTRNRGSARIIIQTSGTTGTPKGAPRDAASNGLGALANLIGSVPYRRSDVVLCPAPMFHSFGLATFTFATALGATLVLPERFDPEESLALIEEHRASAASFVPVMVRRIVSLPEEVKARYDLSSLRIVMTSGSALSIDLKRAATELFGEVLYDLYGSTEVGWVAIASPEVIKERPRSVGRPVEGIEVAVFSSEGERLPRGETGELYIKSDVLFEGYTSGETKDSRDGFMSVGDLGRLDEEGYLYIESRSDDMVVIGGENVYPIEVEETIEEIPGVSEVTVLGIEDDEYGQVLAAFVVGDTDEEEIRSRCKEELASYKVPRKIEILDELPRTSTGKVLKRDLAARSRSDH